MKITMVGTGYVGLVTGTCLAESGNEVVCVDKDEQKVATLESGQLTIYEPGLLELVSPTAARAGCASRPAWRREWSTAN